MQADNAGQRMFPVGFPYKRFSQPSQETGDSIRRQNALSFSWSERSGIPLDTTLTLEDKGVSGLRGVSRTDPDRYALVQRQTRSFLTAAGRE